MVVYARQMQCRDRLDLPEVSSKSPQMLMVLASSDGVPTICAADAQVNSLTTQSAF